MSEDLVGFLYRALLAWDYRVVDGELRFGVGDVLPYVSFNSSILKRWLV
jgi:hypothetical protein